VAIACAAALFMCALASAPSAFGAPPANDDFANATPIDRMDDAAGSNRLTNANFEATSEPGEPAHRDLDNTPIGNNNSVWYSWTPDHTSDAIVFVCSFVADQFDPLFGAYTGSTLATLTPTGVNQGFDCDGNAVATDLFNTVPAVGGTTYHFAVADTGSTDTFIIGIEQAPHNDNFVDAESISGSSGSATGDDVFASGQTGEPAHAGQPASQSVWYRWTAPVTGKATLNTCGSEVDTTLAVYTGAAVDSLTPVASNDDGATCSPQSKLSFATTQSTTYQIAIDSQLGDAGAVTLNYVDNKIPNTTITAGPSGATNDATPTFKFKSSLTGSSFQCRFDGHAFAPCSGPAGTHTPSASLTDGPHTFAVKASKNGVPDPTPATRTFSIDTHRPQTSITAGPTGLTHDNTPTFKFSSSEAGSTFQCVIRVAGGNGSFGACSGPGASHTPSLPLAKGNYVFSVRARDKAGNTDSSPASRSFTVN
jgi:hypothetical protein